MNCRLHAITVLSMLGYLAGARTAHAAAPSVNECLAASDSSLKFNSEHKLRAEREQLMVCAADTCPREIRQECLRRVEQVNQALPTIVFEAKDRFGRDATQVQVTMDNEVLTEHLDGMAIAVDPGEHRFVFKFAAEAPIERQLVISAAQKNRHEVISFAPTTKADQPAAEPIGTAGPSKSEPSKSMSGQRIAAIVSAGVGVLGIGVGTAFGLVAKSKKSDAEQLCPGERYCANQAGVDRWDTAQSAGNLSTIGFIVGGVGLAGAAVLWFTDHPSTPQVGLGIGGLTVRGKW